MNAINPNSRTQSTFSCNKCEMVGAVFSIDFFVLKSHTKSAHQQVNSLNNYTMMLCRTYPSFEKLSVQEEAVWSFAPSFQADTKRLSKSRHDEVKCALNAGFQKFCMNHRYYMMPSMSETVLGSVRAMAFFRKVLFVLRFISSPYVHYSEWVICKYSRGRAPCATLGSLTQR